MYFSVSLRLNGKHGAGVPESEFRSRSLGVGAPECDVKKWKTRSIKYGKHGVQNMENTEYKIWKTRSLTLNMENTECDVKNMENTESDVLSA